MRSLIDPSNYKPVMPLLLFWAASSCFSNCFLRSLVRLDFQMFQQHEIWHVYRRWNDMCRVNSTSFQTTSSALWMWFGLMFYCTVELLILSLSQYAEQAHLPCTILKDLMLTCFCSSQRSSWSCPSWRPCWRWRRWTELWTQTSHLKKMTRLKSTWPPWPLSQAALPPAWSPSGAYLYDVRRGREGPKKAN